MSGGARTPPRVLSEPAAEEEDVTTVVVAGVRGRRNNTENKRKHLQGSPAPGTTLRVLRLSPHSFLPRKL